MQSYIFDFCKKYHPIQDFTFGKLLGSGSFSVVKECYRKDTKEKYAMKIIKKRCVKEMCLLENEVQILKEVNHPNIIQLIDLYETQEELFLLMEFISGGELYDFLINNGPFEEENTFSMFRQILEAVSYLHEHQICHRDIKLENILWTESTHVVKLTDFGLSKSIRLQDDVFMSTPVGTPSYVAPELIQGNQYQSSIDIWSLGIVLYLLLFCKYPFQGDCLGDIFQQIENGVHFPTEIEISNEAKDLLLSLLQEDPVKRITLPQIMSHPWVTRYTSQ